MTWLVLALAVTAAAPEASAPTPVPVPEAAELVPVAVPEPSPRAMELYRSGVWIWFGVQAWRLLVPSVILLTGLSARMRNLAKRVGRNWYGTIAVYGVLYLVLMSMVDLPMDYYLGYVRPHHYQLSNQSLTRWFSQEVKTLGVMAVASMAFLWVPYLILARAPRRWWLYTSALTLPFTIFVSMIMPVWVDPLFNAFGPMKNQVLEAKIVALAHQAGIEGGRVFEVDKSRDTKTVNAYVTGLFGTKRIVLWDTLLAGHNEKEVLAVMGHEMGHYVLNHVAWGVALSTLGALILLFLVDRSGRILIARFGSRLGFDTLSDVASVPLFVLLLAVFNLAGAPIHLAISRSFEHEADRFALEITRGNHSSASAFAKLQRDNLANPRPGWLYVLWRTSHPPLGERIDFCNQYHPWTEGKPGRYEDRFVSPRPDS